jgi:hypothetical protein
MKKKTDMVNHIPIKQMWLEEIIILIKYVKKWVDQKLLKNLMKKKFYNISKDQSSKIGLSKKWKGWKNLTNNIKWKP